MPQPSDFLYSKVQRLAFALLILGSCTCFITSITPFWRHSKINIGVRKNDSGGVVECADFYDGILYDYLKLPSGEKQYQAWYFDKGREWQELLMILGVQFLLSMACILSALCRVCRGSLGGTLCHGIMAFLAGGSGLAVVYFFFMGFIYSGWPKWIGGHLTWDYPYDYDSSMWYRKCGGSHLDWAMYVYTAGVVCIILSSFMLCCTNGKLEPLRACTTPAWLTAERATRGEAVPLSGLPAYSA